MKELEPQILVAGVGNAFLADDGFGGHVVKALGERELPAGVQVMDFGTGGLDLAYEVMRGYHGLILVDASEQGGKPGTLYVLEPDPEEIEAGIEDGEVISPHGMDPQTVLRFVKTLGAWPGKVVVVACEPAEVEEMGLGTMSIPATILAVFLHVGAMLIVMGAVALLVYDKLGVRVLRKAWINSDHLWAASFVLAGAITLVT